MYPIAVAQMRTATRDFVFADTQIKADEMVYVATSVPHFMSEFYPDPHAFDIDRYAKPRAEDRAPGAYSPFGRGPHLCLGKSLAEVQMALTIATLFHRRQLALPSPDYRLKTSTAPTPGPARSFAVRVLGAADAAATGSDEQREGKQGGGGADLDQRSQQIAGDDAEAPQRQPPQVAADQPRHRAGDRQHPPRLQSRQRADEYGDRGPADSSGEPQRSGGAATTVRPRPESSAGFPPGNGRQAWREPPWPRPPRHPSPQGTGAEQQREGGDLQ